MAALLSPDEVLTLTLLVTIADQKRNGSRVQAEKSRKLLARLTALEVPDLNAILDDLREMEDKAEKAEADHVPGSQAKAHCKGRAGAFRDAHTRVCRDNIEVIG